ncbi:MAG: esterase/lipase family protein [Pseudomonadota bacterium]
MAAGNAPGQVVLLHGIWMRSPSLWWLERRLRAAGFHTGRFDYASVFGAPERAVAALRARLRAAGAGPVHLVGHSLGGLVAIAACRDAAGLPPGRILCLGSPLAGSAAARAADRWPGVRELVGGWRAALLDGVGALLARLPRPHDGTVALSETRVDGLSDHLAVDASHTGMLLDPDVAAAAARILRCGRLGPGADGHVP